MEGSIVMNTLCKENGNHTKKQRVSILNKIAMLMNS